MTLLIFAIISLITAFSFIFLAGKFSAMQDAVKHYPLKSIFNKIYKVGTTKKILGFDTGILYEYWYNLYGKDYLAKYEDYDNTKPKRKFNIWGCQIHIIQITDGWHWWKMWGIVFYNLSDIFSSITSILLFLFLYINVTMEIEMILIIFILFYFLYFWIAGYCWNLGFNIYYNEKLRKE